MDRRMAGFTLVEMIMVVAVIGIVASLAAPRIDYTRFRIDSAVRGVGNRMLMAQRLAVTRQHDVIVRFDVANSVIRVHDDLDNDGAVGNGEHTTALPLSDQVVIGLGSSTPLHPVGAGPITFSKRVENMPAVTFHRNGSASEYGGIYLTSKRNRNGGTHPRDSRLVVVDRATGRVATYRFDGSEWIRGS